MITRIDVTVEGISPLLMNRFPLEPIEAMKNKTAEAQAEIAAYRDAENELYVPGINLQRALVNGASFSKGKGRASLQKQAAACMLVFPEVLGLGTREYLIDARRVVVPATRGSVIRYRPRLDDWKLTFELEYDDALVSDLQARQIVDDTGIRIGLCDFRPERKGPFGRFKVIYWSKSGE